MKPYIGYIIICIFITSGCNSSNKKQLIETQDSLKKTASQINADFQRIRTEATFLTERITHLYENGIHNNTIPNTKEDNYFIDNQGVFRRKRLENQPSVFVSNYYPFNENTKNIILATEPLDKELIRIKNTYPEVVQIYYNDSNNYTRIYPAIDVNTLPPNFNTKNYNFYYLADKIHNPEKKAIWINTPYLDPAERGWMISVIVPVYYNEDLVGVVGIDITINTIIEKYLSLQKQQLMLTSSGYVISSNSHVANLLSMQYFKTHKYLGLIEEDVYLSDEYNLLKSVNISVRELATKVIFKQKKIIEMPINKDLYTFISAKIKETDWYILEVIRK